MREFERAHGLPPATEITERLVKQLTAGRAQRGALVHLRLRSDIWVAAYLRRCGVEGVSAVLRRRGAAEAGAIFVKVDHLNGFSTLYEPAPQSVAADAEPGVEGFSPARMKSRPSIPAPPRSG